MEYMVMIYWRCYSLVFGLRLQAKPIDASADNDVECWCREMAGAGSDVQSLKRLLNDTAAACQQCLAAVDTVVSSDRQPAVSTLPSTAVSLLRFLVDSWS